MIFSVDLPGTRAACFWLLWSATNVVAFARLEIYSDDGAVLCYLYKTNKSDITKFDTSCLCNLGRSTW